MAPGGLMSVAGRALSDHPFTQKGFRDRAGCAARFRQVPIRLSYAVVFLVCGIRLASAQPIPFDAPPDYEAACDAAAFQGITSGGSPDSPWLHHHLPRLGEIQVSPVYYGEVFTNTRGGIATSGSTQYLGLLDLGFEWDFTENQSLLPGKFYLLAQNTHGQGITTDFVGDSQVVSNIDSFENIMQVSEYWLEFELFDGAVTLRLGKQDINTEFLFIGGAADFIQSTFGLSPSTAYPTYPDPSMAAVAVIKLNDDWQLKVGLWDAFASGRGWGFSGNDSIVLIGELERAYALDGGRLPGAVAFGAVYESAVVIDGEPLSEVSEYFVQFEQLVYREDDGEDDGAAQGLGIFMGYYPRVLGSQILLKSIGDSFVAGATYSGLFPRRDRDVLGAGFVWTELFQGGTNRETVLEIFYRAQLNSRFSLQPDLQYIGSPSGIYPDALVAGARMQITF